MRAELRDSFFGSGGCAIRREVFRRRSSGRAWPQQFSFWLVETLLIVSLAVARVIAGAQMLSTCSSAGFSYRSPWHLGHRRPPTMNRTVKMRTAGEPRHRILRATHVL